MSEAVTVCEQCVESGGLCGGCADHDKSILPQLAQPAYVKLINTKSPLRERASSSLPVEIPPLNTQGRRAMRRLARALRGEHTRSMRRAL